MMASRYLAACALLVTWTTLGVARGDSFGTGELAFDIEFLSVGDVGNPSDATGQPNPSGAVGHPYRLGKYEVTRDALLKANAAGALQLSITPAPDDGTDYSQQAARGVSWNEAARFVNWLNTSQGYAPAYKFINKPAGMGLPENDTSVNWAPSDPGYNPANPRRNGLARYVLPTNDEWHKAAYYDPAANGGLGGYWDFPTGNDTPPTPVAAGMAASTAVYDQGLVGSPANVALAGGPSPYGAIGQGGNVMEWTETSMDPQASIFAVRGGSWISSAAMLQASSLTPLHAFLREGYWQTGFRVASVPEPGGQFLTIVGLTALVRRRRRS